MIDFLGALFGPYPFDSYGAIYDRAPNVGYALEVQTKSHFSSLDSGASTYLHELSHQWFGNAVTLEQWDDIWFNEGWARFSEWLFNFATGASPTSPAEQFASRYDDPAFDWSIAPAVLDGDPANLFKSTPTYTRGAMVLEGYRQIVGDVRFYALAKTIQGAFAYANISTGTFVDLALLFSGFTGDDLALLEQYFDQWLFGTTKPAVVPDSFD
jgi:aminopeptidase N